MGRTPKYDPERQLPFVKMLAEKGCTDREIYKALGICESTFYLWQQKHTEFSETLKNARFQPLLEVEAALFKRAVGYEYSETTLEPGGVDGKEMVVTKIVQKQMAPNVTAGIFWTINRGKHRWKDTRAVRADEAADGLNALLSAMAISADKMREEDKSVEKFRPARIEDMKNVTPGNNGGNGHGE